MMRCAWLYAGILLMSPVTLLGGEKSPAPTAQEVKALIDQLVSPNPTGNYNSSDIEQ